MIKQKKVTRSKPLWGQVVCLKCQRHVDLAKREEVRTLQIEMFTTLHQRPGCEVKVLNYQEIKNAAS